MQPHDSSDGPPISRGLYRLLITPDHPVDLPLIDAINEENLTEEEKLVKVKELIDSKANINLEDNDDRTALSHAASRGYAKIIKALIDALNDEVSADGKTPLAEAINNVSADGKTPLAEACFNNHFLAAKVLIEAGANLKDLINGKSLLFITSELGNNEIVEILIGEKADLNQANKDEETPIYAACKYGHHDVVKQLIVAKADLNQANKNGESPIFVACKNGHADMVKQLIVAGANFDQANNKGESPIFVACENGHHNVVQQLIEVKADLNQAKNDGTTLIFIASQYCHHVLIKQLIEAKADVNKADNYGITPLYVACRGGNIDVINTLFDAGADVGFLKSPQFQHEQRLIYIGNPELKKLIKKIANSKRDIQLTASLGLVEEKKTNTEEAGANPIVEDKEEAGANPIAISSNPQQMIITKGGEIQPSKNLAPTGASSALNQEAGKEGGRGDNRG